MVMVATLRQKKKHTRDATRCDMSQRSSKEHFTTRARLIDSSGFVLLAQTTTTTPTSETLSNSPFSLAAQEPTLVSDSRKHESRQASFTALRSPQ
jgi:hypothetical protein